MRTFRDAKLMARALRAELAQAGIDVSHSRALEIVAAQFGLPDWNVLAARIGEAGGASGSGAAFQGAIPILRIFDLAKAREFYTGFLGLSEDWEHRFGPDFPAYLQVSRAGLILHLTEHHGDASPGGNAFVWMQGLDAFHAEITGRGYAYAKPGIDTWDLGSDDMGEARVGMRVMEVTDPFGNRLRFAEPLPASRRDEATPAAGAERRGGVAPGGEGDPGPGTLALDPDKLGIFRAAVMEALAEAPGGLFPADLADRVRERVPEALQGGGLRWWVTAAGFDLEAGGSIARHSHGRTQILQAAPGAV
ncbi:glyoxalase superfamily protein [Tabrizicola flagellatus]|uniref:glyoxalase superfamily protein n=1 Tax=Tabrizicola flagellatus TaxID=2593021 RepID=UPI001CA3D364|nr:glyoxalase superfamily protein [Tabrizicola flagellatus]